jgi:hypothetical protein
MGLARVAVTLSKVAATGVGIAPPIVPADAPGTRDDGPSGLLQISRAKNGFNLDFSVIFMQDSGSTYLLDTPTAGYVYGRDCGGAGCLPQTLPYRVYFGTIGDADERYLARGIIKSRPRMYYSSCAS